MTDIASVARQSKDAGPNTVDCRAALAMTRQGEAVPASLTFFTKKEVLDGGAGALPRLGVAGASLGHGAM